MKEAVEFVVEKKKLLEILNAARLGGELDTAQLRFDRDGIEIRALNTANTLGCYAKFSTEYFNDYNCPNPMRVAIPLIKLLKLIKTVDDSEFKVTVKDNAVVFNDGVIEAPTVGYDEKLELPNSYEPKEFELGVFMLPSNIGIDKYNYTRIQIPRKINPLEVDNVILIIKNGSISLYQQDDIGHKVKYEISSIVENFVSEVKVAVDAMLLKHALDTIGSDECCIGLGYNDEGVPLPIQLCTKQQNHSISLIIAPKLEAEV